MIRVSQIRLTIDENTDMLPQKIAKKLKVSIKDILSISIYKESIDARKMDIYKVYTVDVEVRGEEKLLKKKKDIKKTPDEGYCIPSMSSEKWDYQPVVVGFGPAGMFAALILMQSGLKPIVLERGEDVEKRTASVERFWETGILDIESNVQYGEGGAGTFSDGKLTTRIQDMRCRYVLKAFVEAGAPEEILYKNKPHVGTDKLKNMVKSIRKKLIEGGAKIFFQTKMENIILENGKVEGVITGAGKIIKTNHLVLAIGHSARDTVEALYRKGVVMVPKALAVGVRIEHPQSQINRIQYGNPLLKNKLGAAEYRLSHQVSQERGVYTFCMCPGGSVVGASSEEGYLAVNGMSTYSRDKINGNSALLVSVKPSDFPSTGALCGIEFQRSLEKKAFLEGGGDYFAPVQTVGDFLVGQKTNSWSEVVLPSYKPGIRGGDFRNIFPDFIIKALKEGILALEKKFDGFSRSDAILTAVESRSSSPVRITRHEETFESLSIKGLYPCGEGAGYAGGIMSSAVDGIKVAEKIIYEKKETENM